MAQPTAPGFADRLLDAIDRCGSPACVGLDPVTERFPRAIRAPDDAAAVLEFSAAVIGEVAGIVPAIKFQSACYERLGAPGIAALAASIDRARRQSLAVILDAKRGDIGISAEHYAATVAGLGADAVTVNGYLGMETIEPYLAAGLGVFVLVRTSNPGGDAVQSARLADGRTVAEMMADHVAALGAGRVGARGYSDVGAVVGATKAADGAALRARMPRQLFLVPGYGAQGGTAADIRALLGTPAGGLGGGRGVLVTASRSVIYAFEARDTAWTAAIGRAAAAFAGELRSVVVGA